MQPENVHQLLAFIPKQRTLSVSMTTFRIQSGRTLMYSPFRKAL